MAKQESAALFEESSQGAVSVVTAIGFLFSLVLVVGGMIGMSYGFQPSLGTAELWIFAGGLVATFIGFLIPFAVLPAIGK
ncbi:hypothetical protein JD292_02025 [Leucobacter sp. CSA2]|uniref:Uncharacterized protein n=1 Tax=Leucobacter edaphi TaxID=2796472 RepID=A0A934UXF0_9MICO|nr:hypothetical protein [Leucobacter edaphi]MBK0420857.1 hypothetical protein [Leucobacter edaphi]